MNDAVIVIATLLCVQAASMALRQFPVLNSSVDDNCENITFKVCYVIKLEEHSESAYLTSAEVQKLKF